MTTTYTITDIIASIDEALFSMDVDAALLEQARRECRHDRAEFVRSCPGFLHRLNPAIIGADYICEGGVEYAVIYKRDCLEAIDITNMSNQEITHKMMRFSVRKN